MIELVWGASFRRAYKKAIKSNPELENNFWKLITLFEKRSFSSEIKNPQT